MSATARTVTERIEAGTVDYLREVAPGIENGAYLRVTPRPGGGTVIVMTVPLGTGVDAAEVAFTLRAELAALVTLCLEGAGA